MKTINIGSFLAIMTVLIAVLGCSKLGKFGATNVSNDPGSLRSDEKRTYTESGKEWASFDLDQTDMKVDLPAMAADKTPPMPPSYKEVFSAMHIYAFDDRDFTASFSELAPTGKRKWKIKELADTSMTALKKQLPSLIYTLDVQSETNAKYNGSFTRNGKNFDLIGCCIYKKSDPARVWAVMALYPKDNADARAAGQRIIDSVAFKGASETCR